MKLRIYNLTILVFAFIVGILSTIADPAANPPNDIILSDNVSNNSATYPLPVTVREFSVYSNNQIKRKSDGLKKSFLPKQTRSEPVIVRLE